MTDGIPKILNQTGFVILQMMVIHIMVMLHRFAPMLRKWLIHHTTMQEQSLLQQLAEDACRIIESKNLGAEILPGLAVHQLDAAVQWVVATASQKHLDVAKEELRTAVEAAWQHRNHAATT